MKQLIKLKYGEAKEIISKQIQVYWRSGVWNDYQLRKDIDKVLVDVDNAPFGVDVFDNNGDIYVSKPSAGDMF